MQLFSPQVNPGEPLRATESRRRAWRVCNYENMLVHGISCKVRVDKYRGAK
jgi:hypothetical protein